MRRITLKECSAATGYSAYALRQGIMRGRFPAVVVGGRYLLDVAEIERILDDEARDAQESRRQACKTEE